MKTLQPSIEIAQEIVIEGSETCQTWRLIDPIPTPKLPTLVLDTGRSTNNGNKWGRVIDCKTIQLRKFPCNLKIKESAPATLSSSNYLTSEVEDNDESAITFEVDGITYSAGYMAADEGGGTGLGERKSVNIKPRVISGLILFGIEGPFNLSLTATYESREDFDSQCQEIEAELSRELTWTSNGQTKRAVCANLQIVPESSFGWKFPNIFEPEQHPDFKGIAHCTIDSGFQSLNFIFRNDKGKLNTALSKSFKEFGASGFYGEVANRIGAANSESPQLINAINQQRPKFFLPEKRKSVPLKQFVDAARPGFEKVLFEKCLDEIAPGYYHITLIGGGMHLFGESLAEKLSENFEVILAPQFPELAQVVAQCFEAAAKFPAS